jgi:molecular chaperone DnaK (HSP70)
MLSHVSVESLGGRNIDAAFARWLVRQFKGKYELDKDVLANHRTRHILMKHAKELKHRFTDEE